MLTRQRLVLLAALGLVGCHTAPETRAEADELHEKVQMTIDRFEREKPQLKEYFQTAHGYAVFPSIVKAGIGLGGAFGRGEVYEKRKLIGWCSVSQGTIGFQLGGQGYSQVIFFERQYVLEKFKTGTFELAAQASGVGVTAGAGTTVPYTGGVAVFTLPLGGLMGEASLGGQQFDFEPKRE
jgi:lipid-binding SYLF domain-containing protein